MNNTRIDVDAYLDRIGAQRPRRADINALRYLQERHLRSVPFETIDFSLREPIALGTAAVDKIVRRGRGGGCYELNSAFALLLEALGFTVRLLPGRVLHTGTHPKWGELNGHMNIRVDCYEPWIVDVGFRWSSRGPLRLNSRLPQQDPHGTFELSGTPEGDVEVALDGIPRYLLESRPRSLADFGPTLWWFRTCPDSPVHTGMWVSLVTGTGRISLSDRTISRIVDGQRSSEVLDDARLLEALRTEFGIEIDRLPPLPELSAGVR